MAASRAARQRAVRDFWDVFDLLTGLGSATDAVDGTCVMRYTAVAVAAGAIAG